jgi:hypothetical protein
MCDGFLYTTMLATVHFVVIVMIVELDARCFVQVGTNLADTVAPRKGIS